MKKILSVLFVTVLLCGAVAVAQDPTSAQSTYTPKFQGDPARSDSEAAALGYMRVVVNAQKNYRKKRGNYASSLQDLVGQGSFTRRMISTSRGDYTARFKGAKDGYALWMTPNTIDASHRAFFVDESGKIKAEEDEQASATSPAVTAR